MTAFTGFSQRNATAVALLASIVSLGFIIWHFCLPPEPPAAPAASHPDWRTRFRAPRRSEEDTARLKEIVVLQQKQFDLLQEQFRAGSLPFEIMLESGRELEAAKIAWLRAAAGHRYSLGFAEGLSELKWAKQWVTSAKGRFASGTAPLTELNQTEIDLLKLEVKYSRLLRYLARNEEFAKLAEAFNSGKAPDEALKALLEAEALLFESDRPYWKPAIENAETK